MKALELVQLAKGASADAFAEVTDKQSEAIVRAVLAELSRQIREASGPVDVAAFGRFIVRDAAPDEGGPARRRVLFRPAPRRDGNADAASAPPAAKVAAKRPRAAAGAGRAARAGKTAAAGGAAAARKPATREAKAAAARQRKAAKKQS